MLFLALFYFLTVINFIISGWLYINDLFIVDIFLIFNKVKYF